MHEEGWYVDPFGRHEARWMSDGRPTALVRDDRVESQDPPPDDPMTEPLELVRGTAPPGGSDQKRADDADAEGFDPDAGARAAFDTMDQIGPGVFWHRRP